MKKLSFDEMKNVQGGDLSTLSACFKAMYNMNTAVDELTNADSYNDYLNACWKIVGAAEAAQKSWGELQIPL